MIKRIHIILLLLATLSVAEAQEYYSIRKNGQISSSYDEVAAVGYGDTVVYATQHSEGAIRPENPGGERLFTIYQLKEGENQPKRFLEALVAAGHNGPVSFTSDFNTMVYSQLNDKGSRSTMKIYFLKRVNGQWAFPAREFVYNDDAHSFVTPAISGDGRFLFFAANLEGGYGGWDLYVSRKKGDTWTEPENLGAGVNTAEHEVYPFYQNATKQLCFSSEGHDRNLAGFDLFYTKLVDGAWVEAIKLSAPLNSLSDDYHAWFSEDLKSGYLTSNRRGGTKDIFTFQSDIPNFESPEPIKRTYYKYKIFDRKLDTVDTNLFRYSWLINDTLEIPGHEIIYEFPEPGIYVCKLNVFDIQLDTFLKGQTVNTLNIKLNEQAVIVCPDTIQANTPVIFDGSQTYLPGMDIARYVWDFGDGSFGQGEMNEHTYLYPGRYRVVLGVEERVKKRKKNPDPIATSNFKDVIVIAE